MSHTPLSIPIHFANGQAFIEDYRPFLGAITIPKRGFAQRAKTGDTVVVCSHFGTEDDTYEWPGVVITRGVKTKSNQPGCTIKFYPECVEEIEHVVWSHVRTNARCELRVKTPFGLRLMTRRAGHSRQCLLALDISHGGCQLAKAPSDNLPVAVDDVVTMQWGSRETTGHVRWVSNGNFGVMFDRRLGAQT